jgi:3-oxoacyl-[acyl-carrier protein] reductase
MAAALLKDGHRVVLSSTDEKSLQDTIAQYAQPGQAKYIVADLAKPGEPERLAKEAEAAFGQIDILVNNAGISVGNIRSDYLQRPFRFWEATRAQMEYFFAVNTLQAMILAAALAPAMIKRGWGRIVANTTSMDTMLRISLYGMSKAGLEAETAIQSSDLEGTGVTANVLVPGGGTGSRMTDLANIPRDQLLPPEIMGPPISFLASDDSNDFNARRIIARRWDTTLPPREAAMLASDVIAWKGYGTQAVNPPSTDPPKR